MWWVLHALLFQALAREFAVVRPFASDQEIQDMGAAFRLWNTVHPCGDKALAEFDIFVVYSRRLDENFAAWTSARNLQNSFRARSEPWHRCFREFHVEAANLTAVEDIYDSRGYTVRKDWVNGPNKVFRFILQSFLQKSFVSSNNYEAFFFMEFDSTPLRPFWLDQFYAEAVHYPRAAIRGSRYRGDSWDNFLHDIPDSLLYHMNGNAIYFLHHPWLHFLAQKMEEDANSENASTAFDVRMAQLTLEAATRSDLQTAWAESVPTGEDPYRDDSLLVGNYANTLLNESFEAPEFVRHGALTNIFQNLNASSVTLAVQAFHQASATVLTESLNDARHHFREVVVLSTPTLDFAFGNSGPSFREVRATLPEHMAICELASTIQTEYFAFTDTYHFIPGPMHVLANGSQPVLPYIPASSIFCTAYPECTSSLDQAESFFGVKLNYHHSKYETLFQTLLMTEFCESWTLAADTLGSFESCDYQHGPTADDYIAWLISMNKLFDYVPKNKERVGWRHWSILWAAHPPDQRNCSIYRENDALRMQQSIKECSLYIQDADACNANPNCTFREIFEAGKCMSASEFQSLPAIMAARTLTRTATTTRTTSLTTTRSSSQTSSWTSLTATSTSTATKLAIPSTTRVTRTETTQTPLSTAIECQDGLPITAGVDVSNCIGRVAGESCSVFCSGSFEGDPATFICGDDGTFDGVIQCQESTCTLETLPSGFPTDCEQTRPGSACFVRCPDGFHPAESTYICMADRQFLGFPPICEPLLCSFGLPETVGVNSEACVEDIRYGQSCEVVCAYGFEGESSTYQCVDGVFQGIPPSCVRKACQVPSDQGISSCEGVLHGQSCLSTCNPGFTGAATQLQCEDGSLQGLKPNCTGALCSLEGIPIEPGLDATECLGKSTSESCSLEM